MVILSAPTKSSVFSYLPGGIRFLNFVDSCTLIILSPNYVVGSSVSLLHHRVPLCVTCFGIDSFCNLNLGKGGPAQETF